MTSVADDSTIAQLRADLDGRVIGPDDSDYDQARAVFVGDIDARPAVIVRPTDSSQVAHVVTVARDSGLELAVRSGGHSSAGHSTSDGGIVLDLSEMCDLQIDREARTAWAETGLTAGEYTKLVGAHGLATGFGDSGSVGIGGITLGGGVGFLSRKFGLTIDALLAAEIVTADGQILEVDAENHPELFWAIRGGGGNFGVATRFKYRLEEVESVVGGMLMLPATAEVVRGFIAEAEAAPDELSTIANVMPAPPMPFIPAELHGELIVMALVCFAGPAEDGERALAPFRALSEPLVDMVKPIPYAEMYQPEPEDYHPTAVIHNMYMDRVEARDAETIVEYISSSDATNRVVQLRVLGGAIARVPGEATAYAHRGSRIMANVVSFYEGPEDRAVRQAWVSELAGKLRQDDGGVYVNFLGDEGPDRIRAAYPDATWERLRAVKAQYDPTNLFASNQNVPPA